MSIGKRLIIIFLSSFIGITTVPDILVSADAAPISDVKFAEVKASVTTETPVKTTVATTPVTTKTTTTQTKPAAQTQTQTQTAPVTQKPVQVTPTTQTPATPAVTPAPAVKPNQIVIGGRTISMTIVKDTRADAGNHVNMYCGSNAACNKFIYGHNSAAVFGNLKNLRVGVDTFTVTLNGTTSTYRIVNKVIYDYELGGNGALRLNGDTSINYMNRTAKAKDNNNVQYDLALMTCHGQSLGNGNATQRLVLFANKI